MSLKNSTKLQKLILNGEIWVMSSHLGQSYRPHQWQWKVVTQGVEIRTLSTPFLPFRMKDAHNFRSVLYNHTLHFYLLHSSLWMKDNRNFKKCYTCPHLFILLHSTIFIIAYDVKYYFFLSLSWSHYSSKHSTLS